MNSRRTVHLVSSGIDGRPISESKRQEGGVGGVSEGEERRGKGRGLPMLNAGQIIYLYVLISTRNVYRSQLDCLGNCHARYIRPPALHYFIFSHIEREAVRPEFSLRATARTSRGLRPAGFSMFTRPDHGCPSAFVSAWTHRAPSARLITALVRIQCIHLGEPGLP